MQFEFEKSNSLIDDFFNIEENQRSCIVSYYEKHFDQIQYLDPLIQFKMLDLYGESLYDLEYYKEYIPIAKEILELSILESWQYIRGRDIFMSTLKCLCYSYYQVENIEACKTTTIQLCKMQESRKARALLYRCIKEEKKTSFLRFRSLFVSCHLILVASLVLSVLFGELVLNIDTDTLIKTILKVMAWVFLTWLVTEFYFKWKVFKTASRLLD